MAATNQQKIEALKLARDAIANKFRDFLCHALEDVMQSDNVEQAIAAEHLKEYVVASLGGLRHGFSPTVEDWHTDNGFGDRGDAQRRLDRLAWIDWMILCLEGWEPHNGGEQPVDHGTYVIVKLRNGKLHKRYARNFRWFNWLEHGLSGPPQTEEERAQGHEHDIVAWRVAKP